MNHKKFTLFAILLSTAMLEANAQEVYSADAILYSQPEFGATARFKALGGAQTALGGDLSNISGNPAGLGFFNNSDFGVTLDFYGTSNRANYLGNSFTTKDNRVGINQLGIVFNLPNMRARGSNLDHGWLNFNVGIGYAKTNNYSGQLGFSGTNTGDSFVENMVEGDLNTDGLAKWGHEAGLIGVDQNGIPFRGTALPNDGYTDITEKGYQSETNLSFGANYSNKLYIGASLGITSFRYKNNYRYEEYGRMYNEDELLSNYPGSSFLDPVNYPEQNAIIDSDYELAYGENLITTGTGVNAKLGFIYRPVDAFRIGFSATTPTWNRMSDDFENSIGIYNVNPSTGEDVLDPYTIDWGGTYYEYNLRTPYRLNAGVAGIFARGLISADVEYVDYSSTHFSSDDQAETRLVNENIKDIYQGAINFRVGGELMVVDNFLVRAGYNRTGNPYKELSSTKEVISGGLGYRINNIYIDATYQNYRYNYTRDAYAFGPTADVKTTRNNVFLTIGTKF